MNIDDQRKWKQQHVEDALARIGGFPEGFPCPVSDVVGTKEV
jgi:tRNA/tmRNA/rRNA uracil-C5-methylase (TrmA/RlmC/RlmD family)